MSVQVQSVEQPVGAFGVRLRALREAAGLTQEELAERAGLTAYAVSALERGKRQRPYPHTVRCLVDALGASDEQRSLLLEAIPRRAAPAAPEVPTQRAEPVTRAVPAAPSLLGRDAEIEALADLVRTGCRLITLTGTGGVGKTSLATALVARVATEFPDGATVVSLAPVADPAGVLPAVARAVGAALDTGDGQPQLVEHLRPLRLLLVLDNLEHLLAVADQVAELVAACPRLVVVVTSRAPLRVRGEVEIPVQPLALPAESANDSAEVERSAAVQVFTARARAVSPGFEVTDANAAAVSALCRRLAGIPLALELAAARVRFLGPQALLARLDDAMTRGGGPDLPERQRTMRATFDWSYDLLPAPEQRLLRLLSVFSGGGTLEAVEAVSTATAPDQPVLPLLEVLVEHSLVVVDTDDDGEPRFRLLEPVAQYARSRQDDAERLAVHDAHTACYLDLVERAAPEYLAGEQVVWLDRVERDDANVVAALTWALERGDGETAGRMSWSLWLYWWLRGRSLSGLRLARQALPLEMPPEVRTRTTLTAACMAFTQGDLATAGAQWRQAEEHAWAGTDPIARRQAAAGVGLVHLAQGDLDAAEQRFLSALPDLEAHGLYGEWLQSLVHIWIGTVQMVRGDVVAAVEPMRRGLESARARGDRLTSYIALFNLSQSALARGDVAVAREHLHEGIRLTQQTRDLANLAYLVEALSVADAAGPPERVAVLVGAAEALRELVGARVYGYYKPDEALREQAASGARAALGDDAYGDAVDVGRSLTPEEIAAYALGDASV